MTCHHPNLSSQERAAVTYVALAFRAGMPIRHILDKALATYGTAGWKNAVAQHAIISETLRYTPPRAISSFSFGERRRARFARLLLDEVDRTCGAELDETLLDSALVSCTAPTPAICEGPGVNVVIDLPGLRAGHGARNRPITAVLSVSELFSDIGLRVWEAALCVHAHITFTLSSLYADVPGRRVLELGSGTGLSAIALVEASAEHIVLTDYTEGIIANMGRNVERNVAQDKRKTVSLGILDVFESSRVHDLAVQERIDTVIAADLMYDPGLMQAVIRSFRAVVCHTGCVGYLFSTTRNVTSDELLDKELARSGMQVELLDEDCGLDFFEFMSSWDLRQVRVFRFLSRPTSQK